MSYEPPSLLVSSIIISVLVIGIAVGATFIIKQLRNNRV